MQQAQGDKLFATYLENTGGLNIADSPFTVGDGQATGGYNYDYTETGGFQKSLCPTSINSSANAQLKSLGLALRHTKAGVKSIIRAAGTKIQLTDLGGTFTNLTEDTTAAGSDFLSSSSKQPVVDSMFSTPSTDILWLAGGGMSSIYGVVSGTKVSKNGVPAPTGEVDATETGGGGEWATTGTYYYAVAYRKASTGALSNCSLDFSVTVSNAANSYIIDLSGLTNLDSTKYDKIYLYRSAVGGAEDFTAGDLVAQIDSTETSYTDTGSSISESEVVPRAGNTVLDNSELPSGTFECVTTWKQRLVTAYDSTIVLSDTNKPESWPSENTINVPSGGKITALAVISFTPNAQSTDEYLAVFKETELWVVTGSNVDDWELKFVDYTGSLGPALIVSANGYLYFMDNRGAYLWDGVGKPIYISRPIEKLWGMNGTLDRSKLYYGRGVFFKRQNQVIWYLSDSLAGEQQYVLKLDLRLTLPRVETALGRRVIDGVFLQGKVNDPVYAAAAFVFPTSSNQEEVLITGDDAGFIYRQFYSTTGEGDADYAFTYDTKYHDQGKPGLVKQYYQVVAWVENLGNWPIYLDYWTDYRSSSNNKNTASTVVNSNTAGDVALWDIAKWDQAEWDGYVSRPKRIVFNLAAPPYNNNQGEVIKLRFRNENSDEPVTVYGYGISYAILGTRT